jgi:hypothetical protein
MRTTLTLDDDVARLIDDAMHRERKPMKQVVNEALRRALSSEDKVEPYRISPHHSRVRAGVDVTALNRLADEFDDEAILAKGASAK